jgi:hypothetical protein
MGARHPVVVPIPVDPCRARRRAIMVARRRVVDLTLDDRCLARRVAATMAAEAEADRPAADHAAGAAAAATAEEEGRTEVLLPAVAIPRRATTDTNRFLPRFTHSSLTVRRLRKGPPVLPEDARGCGKQILDGTAHDQVDDALEANDLHRN